MNNLYNDVLADLRGNQTGGVYSLSSNDIYLKFKNAGRSYGISKDEETFYDEIWPKLDDLRAKNGVISSTQNQQNGTMTTMW